MIAIVGTITNGPLACTLFKEDIKFGRARESDDCNVEDSKTRLKWIKVKQVIFECQRKY